MVEIYTQGEIQIFSEPLLHSALTRLVPGHFKALNNLNFYSLLDFHKSHTGPSQGTKSSSFYSLLDFHKSHTGPSQGTKSSSFYSLLYFHKSH